MDNDDALGQAIEAAFEPMTDEKAADWVRAGDYTSVGGVAIPAGAAKRFAAIISGEEVEGFAFDPAAPSPLAIPYPNIGVVEGTKKGVASLMLHCCTGKHIPEVKL